MQVRPPKGIVAQIQWRDEQIIRFAGRWLRRPFKHLRLKGNRALSALERHFSVRQVAELWSWSDDTVRRRFRHEPGVLAISYQERRGKRPYAKLSIPESVLIRVHERLAVKKKP
jgi:hypothetical protein